MNLVEAGYACGVLATLAGGILFGFLFGRWSTSARLRRALVGLARLALGRGATPTQLEQHIGRDLTAEVCWAADTVPMAAVAPTAADPQPGPDPRFASGRQAVVRPNGRQEAPMGETRLMDAQELRRCTDGGL